MSAPRVFITGVGAVSSLGLDTSAMWTSLRSGTPALRPLPEFALGPLRFDKAGVVDGFPDGRVPQRLLDQSDRFTQFLIAAAGEAVAQAGLSADDPRWAAAAIVTGSGIGGELAHDTAFWDMYGLKKTRVNPMMIP
ncbi:MAG: hypothetical protein KIT83_18285, partial [Bryobacterales bacterium]|nr:hypothetical protein [Bryobacterales bacterium]